MKRLLGLLCQKNFLQVLLLGILASSCGNKNTQVYEDPTRGYIEIFPSTIKVREVSVEQFADMTMAYSRHEKAARLLKSCISLLAQDNSSYRTMSPRHCLPEKRQLDDALELVNVIHKLKELQDSNPQPLLKKVSYTLRRGSINGAVILPGRHSLACIAPLAQNKVTPLIDAMSGVASAYLRGTTIPASLCKALAN